jgi:hypothetical protein
VLPVHFCPPTFRHRLPPFLAFWLSGTCVVLYLSRVFGRCVYVFICVRGHKSPRYAPHCNQSHGSQTCHGSAHCVHLRCQVLSDLKQSLPAQVPGASGSFPLSSRFEFPLTAAQLHSLKATTGGLVKLQLVLVFGQTEQALGSIILELRSATATQSSQQQQQALALAAAPPAPGSVAETAASASAILFPPTTKYTWFKLKTVSGAISRDRADLPEIKLAYQVDLRRTDLKSGPEKRYPHPDAFTPNTRSHTLCFVANRDSHFLPHPLAFLSFFPSFFLSRHIQLSCESYPLPRLEFPLITKPAAVGPFGAPLLTADTQQSLLDDATRHLQQQFRQQQQQQQQQVATTVSTSKASITAASSVVSQSASTPATSTSGPIAAVSTAAVVPSVPSLPVVPAGVISAAASTSAATTRTAIPVTAPRTKSTMSDDYEADFENPSPRPAVVSATGTGTGTGTSTTSTAAVSSASTRLTASASTLSAAQSAASSTSGTSATVNSLTLPAQRPMVQAAPTSTATVTAVATPSAVASPYHASTSTAAASYPNQSSASFSAAQAAAMGSPLHVKVTPPHTSAVVSPSHHYRVSIDLHAIRDLATSYNVWCRYSYPAFGTGSTGQTNPPVEVHKHTEVLLPNGYCGFEFALQPEELERILATQPLFIAVQHKDQKAGNMDVGLCCVDLQPVWTAPTAPHPSHGDASLRVFDHYTPIYAPPPPPPASALTAALASAPPAVGACQRGVSYFTVTCVAARLTIVAPHFCRVFFFSVLSFHPSS